MKTLVLGIALFAATSGTAAQAARLTLEGIFGGDLYDPAPAGIRWAPGGRRVSYFLPEEDGGRSLWVLDLSSGDRTRLLSSREAQQMAPSAEQAGIGERERTRRNRYGLADYLWAPDGRRLLLVSAGRLCLYDPAARESAVLAPSKTSVADPKFSPDGRWVSFLSGHDLWVVSAAGGRERQLTFGGSELVRHGEPDWVYQEEFDVRTGYHWSPDSHRIAFLEWDESAVPAYPIVEQLAAEASVEMERYPKAGDPNPKMRVGCVEVPGGRTVWLAKAAEYVPRVEWADAHAFAVQLLDRAQRKLELVEVEAETGRARTLMAETDPYWVDISGDLTFLSGARQFLWTSDRSGFRHIYLYDRGGKLLRQLTDGNWVVGEIAGVDEEGGWVYYTSNQADTLGRGLFRVRTDGSGTEPVTGGTGTHAVDMNGRANAFVDSYSSLVESPRVRVTDLSSGKEHELFRARSFAEFSLVPPEIRELKTPEGATVRVMVYAPAGQPSGKLPVLVYAYGMPGFPAIQNAWAGNRGLFHQFLVQQGFVVALVDDRSSAIPGHRYAVAGYGKLGSLAARDHETAVRYLRSLPFVDGGRMALWGWSGGGYTVTYHMTHTDLFQAGVAGAPVTDWRLYDSVYTERYMGLPQQEPESYDAASSVQAAPACRGRLLVIFGTQDDNVHPQNTIQLVYALIRSRKQFDLMVYPDKTHGITGSAENIHLYTMIYDFLVRNLR